MVKYLGRVSCSQNRKYMLYVWPGLVQQYLLVTISFPPSLSAFPWLFIYRHLVLPGAAGPCFSEPRMTRFVTCRWNPSNKLFPIQRCISGFPLHLIPFFYFTLSLSSSRAVLPNLPYFPTTLFFFFLKAYFCFGLLTDVDDRLSFVPGLINLTLSALQPTPTFSGRLRGDNTSSQNTRLISPTISVIRVLGLYLMRRVSAPSLSGSKRVPWGIGKSSELWFLQPSGRTIEFFGSYIFASIR